MSKTFYKMILFYFFAECWGKNAVTSSDYKIINKCFVTNNIEHHCNEYLIIFSIPQISIPDEQLSISETILCVLGGKKKAICQYIKISAKYNAI